MTKTIEISIKGHKRTIEFPNIGKYKQIEIVKQVLSGGQYSNMMNASTQEAVDALDMIDMEAMLTVLIPDLDKILSVPFADLSFEDFFELRSEFKKVSDWWKEIEKNLRPIK